MTQGRTVAVTGGTGFIGRHVVDALLEKGYDVLVIGRRDPGDPRVVFIKSDLLSESPDAWLESYRPPHLIHLAWYAEHGEFWTSPENMEWAAATLRLIQGFARAGGRGLVVAGTCAEYDWKCGYCNERHTPLRPDSLYGIAKDCTRRMSEEICRQMGLRLVWGRIFLPFGPGEHRDRLVPAVIQALRGNREPFRINLGHYRDFLPASSVAGALVHLMGSDQSGVFNISSGTPVQLRDVVTLLAEGLAADPTALLDLGESKPTFPRFLVGDNEALLSSGWCDDSDISDSLRQYAIGFDAEHGNR